LELTSERLDGLIGGQEGRNHGKKGRQQKEMQLEEVLFHLCFIIADSWVNPLDPSAILIA
jgi:hypothetical protein